MLYLLETADVVGIDKSDGNTITVGTGGATNAVYIVLCIVGHIIVYNHANVVDVNTAGNDVGGDKNILLSALKKIHHLVALLLRKVAVH